MFIEKKTSRIYNYIKGKGEKITRDSLVTSFKMTIFGQTRGYTVLE